MDKNTHVYCTDCEYFRLCDEGIPYCALPSDKCSVNDCEDSKPFRERPMYKERK